MPLIEGTGRFLETDAEGWLRNPASGRPLQQAWRPTLDRLLEGCREQAGPSFHSFYVRGSVATGTAVAGSSDLDTVLVLDDELPERRPAWQHPLAAEVLAAAPFITDVEVVVLGRGALLSAAADLPRADPVMAQWCFLLAVGARCLAGVDLVPQLGRFRPGPGVAYVLRSLPPSMRTFERRLTQLATLPDDAARAERARLVPWTCKKLLRSGAELAMLADGRFTRDLVPSAQQLAKALPAQTENARRLLEWAIDPPADLSGLERVARELEPELTRAALARGQVPDGPESDWRR